MEPHVGNETNLGCQEERGVLGDTLRGLLPGPGRGLDFVLELMGTTTAELSISGDT